MTLAIASQTPTSCVEQPVIRMWVDGISGAPCNQPCKWRRSLSTSYSSPSRPSLNIPPPSFIFTSPRARRNGPLLFPSAHFMIFLCNLLFVSVDYLRMRKKQRDGSRHPSAATDPQSSSQTNTHPATMHATWAPFTLETQHNLAPSPALLCHTSIYLYM